MHDSLRRMISKYKIASASILWSMDRGAVERLEFNRYSDNGQFLADYKSDMDY